MTGTRILGLVLAGGKSSRFGSDKAEALLGGRSLLDHAITTLSAQCDAVVVVGRDTDKAHCLPDWPEAHRGPLGGLAAALVHAADTGFDAVLSIGVDCIDMPANLVECLRPAPAYIESLPVVGLWPASAAEAVKAILTSDGRHSMRQLAETIGARAVTLGVAPANVNTPDDLARLEARHGL
ncbi:molybdenum cofactor guanylyltransferase [soil metagenome]